MAMKQIILRVDEAIAGQLKARSAIEERSVNSIISDATKAYFEAHPVSREKMLSLVREIAKEDETILKALAEA